MNYSPRPGRLIAFLLNCAFGTSLLFGQTDPERPIAAETNVELKELFRQDQRDRGEDPFDKDAAKPLKDLSWQEIEARDAKRLQQVRALLQAGEVKTAEDHVYAAFILQHGRSSEGFALAHVLATTAALKSQPAPRWARWLAAAALDRFLHHSNRPQIFGTQVKGQKSPEGVMQWTLEPYDRTAVTDAMRKEWCVISLPEQERMLRDASEGKPLGPSNIRDCR